MKMILNLLKRHVEGPKHMPTYVKFLAAHLMKYRQLYNAKKEQNEHLKKRIVALKNKINMLTQMDDNEYKRFKEMTQTNRLYNIIRKLRGEPREYENKETNRLLPVPYTGSE
jgi:hypothetical protein